MKGPPEESFCLTKGIMRVQVVVTYLTKHIFDSRTIASKFSTWVEQPRFEGVVEILHL
jgi:hypothetical protein